jgi:hypothetical protein
VDGSAGICLLHYGYAPALHDQKKRRNLGILRSYHRQHPGHAPTMFYLARECAFAGEFAEGFKVSMETLDYEHLPHQLAGVYAVAAWNAIGLQEWAKAADLTKEARQHNVPTVWTEHFRALALAALGQLPKALEAAERACSMAYPAMTLLNLQDIWQARRFELRSRLLAISRQGG